MPKAQGPQSSGFGHTYQARKFVTSVKMYLDSSVIVSAKKTSNISTGTTLTTLKIYSRCLMHILKVKYTEFKFSYFTTDSSA